MDHWTVCVLKQAFGLWVTILQEIAPVDFKATPTTSPHPIIFYFFFFLLSFELLNSRLHCQISVGRKQRYSFEFLPYLWCRESIRQSSWQSRGHILSAHITAMCCNVYNSPQANWHALFRINGLLVNFPPLPQMVQQYAKDPQIVTPPSETTFGTGCIFWVEMWWGGNLLSNTLLFRMDQIRWGRKSL